VNWQSVVLIAGMLPVATALNKTGALQLLAMVISLITVSFLFPL
jgi:di/tricarboxylate transporter